MSFLEIVLKIVFKKNTNIYLVSISAFPHRSKLVRPVRLPSIKYTPDTLISGRGSARDLENNIKQNQDNHLVLGQHHRLLHLLHEMINDVIRILCTWLPGWAAHQIGHSSLSDLRTF